MAVAGLKRGQTGGEGDYQCLLHCMVTNTYPFHMNPLTRVEPEFDSGSTRLLRSHARVEPISHEPVNPGRTRVRLGFDPVVAITCEVNTDRNNFILVKWSM